MKNRFFQLAFTVLFLQQLGRLLFSMTNFYDKNRFHETKSTHGRNKATWANYEEEFMATEFKKMNNKEERDVRESNLNSECSASEAKTLDSLSAKEKSILLKHIIVSEKYKFLYCYIPKVACSNWKRVVMVLEGISDNFVKDHPHGMKYLSEYSSKEIDYKLQNYFKFTIVRNPLERLLSAYRNKFGEVEDIMKTYGAKIKKKYSKSNTKQEDYPGKIPGDDVSFEEFIRFLLDHDTNENMNEHWAPMNILCQPCAVKYDYIGSYDNLYEDSEEILRHIDAPENLHFPARQSFYSPASLSTTAYYYSLVNNTYLQHLYARYSNDFTLFSYPIPKMDSPGV